MCLPFDNRSLLSFCVLVLRCASLADLRANIKADLRFLQSATSVQSPFSSPSPHPKQAAELEELVSLVTSHAGAQYGWETGLVFSERPPTVLGLKSWQNGLFEVEMNRTVASFSSFGQNERDLLTFSFFLVLSHFSQSTCNHCLFKK